ncbi:cadmium resistance protein CadD (predicted permease) [Streptacidiphilus sp. EB129]
MLILLALSILGAAGLLLLPARGAALAGVLPLTMGIGALVRAHSRHRTHAPVGRGGRQSGTWAVALLSVTCGGDNVALYSPLLAQAWFPGGLVVVAVFAALVPVMCGLAVFLARRAVGLSRPPGGDARHGLPGVPDHGRPVRPEGRAGLTFLLRKAQVHPGLAL